MQLVLRKWEAKMLLADSTKERRRKMKKKKRKDITIFIARLSVRCICQIYGYRVDKKEALPPLGTLKCSQIYSQYHEACVEERGRKIDLASGSWYSCYTCQEVDLGLQGQSGLMNLLHDGA
ncbi:unnamed protein product [Coffea canephora]|uniref:DH200=94 genomic scaffold, scaffold_280 n=1 Tax=Coffea canephora TaxID=49390 RepID=A0A068VD69_COFCA|nr:unnamed protein product [Coffea canephora]